VFKADPTQFESEEAVIKAFNLAKVPDEEFTAKIEDGERVKYVMSDGDDAIKIFAVLCYRGLQDEVFTLCIPECISDKGSYWDSEERWDKNTDHSCN
jgi:hypothetical protein